MDDLRASLNHWSGGSNGRTLGNPEDQSKPGTYGIDVISAASGAAKKKNTAGRDAPIYDGAIKFIEQHKDKPFYMNVWGHVSHHKVDPPQSYIDKFSDKKGGGNKEGPDNMRLNAMGYNGIYRRKEPNSRSTISLMILLKLKT